MALTLGTRIGPYEVTAQIGAGGMGEVYRARDTKLDRDVALKVLPEAFALDSERFVRFTREAQVLASLNHPNIAAIYGFEESAGVRSLVLELVEGPTLADRIAGGPILVDDAVPIATQIASALETAHDQGVIHRDLKPANIKVRHDGTVKVLDFGLAKLTAASDATGLNASQSPTVTSPAMTRTGMILGTAAYMSPEQAKGRAADKRSDVWAFGCVLYEMLTGKRAFEGDGVSDTLAAVLRGEPDWYALPPEVPGTLHSLLQRCLEKDPRRRVGDLSVARFVLEQPVNGAGAAFAGAVQPPRARWKFVAVAAAAALVTAALAGVAAWRLRPTGAAPVVARFSFTLPEGQQVTTAAARQFVAISPDGRQLAYVANGRLFLRSLSEFDAHAIPGTEEPLSPVSPAFSPDGRSIAFYSSTDTAVKRIAVSGGAAVTVCKGNETASASGLSWDSTGILFGQPSGIFRCSPSGGSPEKLATVEEGEEVHGPQMLLDGAALLFTIAKPADEYELTRWDKAQIVLQSMATGTRTTIVNGGSDGRYLSTGHLVYAVGGVVFAVPFDPQRQVVNGEAVPIVEGVRRTPAANTGAMQLATSSTGTMLYVPGATGVAKTEWALALADRAGALTRLSVPPGPYVHVRASRDGTQLAIGTDDGSEATVWIHELAGRSAMRRLTFNGRNRFPIWSPDGRRMAFQSDREGDLGLFVQNADGSGAVERLTKAQQGEAHVPESWSPDGRHLLFSVAQGPRFSLQLLSIENMKTEPYGGVESREEPVNAVFSPDGRWIAYNSRPLVDEPSPSVEGVYLQPFPATGARYQVPKQSGGSAGLRSRDFHPVWSSKGTELFYIPTATSGQLAAVSVAMQPSPVFGNPVNLLARVTADRLSSQMRAYDIMPDGRFVGLIPPSGSEASGAITEMRVVLNWFEELKARVPIR